MDFERQYKAYKMMSTVRQLNKSLWLFHYLVPIFHLFCIIFFMLLNILPQISMSFEVVAEILLTVKEEYLTFNLANIYFIVGLIISLSLVVLAFLRIKVIPNYEEIPKHKKIQKFLLITTVILGYVYEIGIYFFGWSFSEIYDHEGLIIAILKSVFSFMAYVYFSKKYAMNSLYRGFTIPIIILVTTVNNPVTYIIVIIVSFYLIMEEKILMKKIFYGFVALVALFVMKNSQIFQQTRSSQMQISFICLGILVILTPIFIIHIKQKLDISNSEQKLFECYTILNNLKVDIPHLQMKFQQFYQLYNTIITFSLSNKDQKSPQIDEIIEKDPQKISKKQFLFLLQKFLEKQCRNASQSNILKQIYLFKIKTQLQYSPYEIIQDMFNLNEQIKKGNNKAYQEQFFQIFDQTIKKFAVIKNGFLQPAYLIHLNKLHEDFQNKVYSMLDSFQIFWRQIAQDQIKVIALDASFQQVLDIQLKIESLYKDIQKFGYFERQKKIIDITRSLYNVYEEVNKYSRDAKKKAESAEKNFTHSFVILQNGSIKFISKDFMKSLGKKGSLSYENIDKKILFGKDFSAIVDELTKNISASSQVDHNSVPVLNQQGVMQLKKVRIMWYPSLEVKQKIIITFTEDLELAHEAFLIYHFKTDTIKYFNEKFIKMFKIDQQRFKDQIENYQMFFNELFIQTDIPAEQVKKYLKEQNTIKCKIYLKNYVEKGALPSIPVEVNVLRFIYVNNQATHCVLKITKTKQKMDNVVVDPITNQNQQMKQFYQQNHVISKSQNAIAKKWQNQKFFCKIPNHYESKISEKQAQLQQKNRWVFRYYIHILFSIFFLTILIFWILDNKFLTSRIQSYRKQFVAVQNTSQQYTLMYQIFSCVVKDYYMKKLPQQTELVKNMSATFLRDYIKNSQQKFINQFLQLYLKQINSQSSHQLDYKIDFDHFSINTTTNLATLVDFVENAKRHVTESDYEFMLKNYNNFRDLTLKFESSTKSEQNILEIAQSYQKYFFVLISVTSISLISILILLSKIQGSIKTVYSLIERIPTYQLKQNLILFENRKKRILDIFLLSNSDLLKKKVLAMRNVGSTSLGTMTSFNSQITKNTNQLEEDLSYFLDNEYSLSQQKKTKQLETFKQVTESVQSKKQQDPLLNEEKQSKVKQLQEKTKMIKQSLIIKFYRKSLFIFLLLILNGIFILNCMELINQREGMMEVLEIQKNFFTTLIAGKRVTVDAPIRAVMQDYFNKTIPPYINSQISLSAALPNHMILSQMKGFAEKAHQALQQNMCNYAPQYVGSPLMSKPCETYLNGVVTKGFRQAYGIFLHNAKLLSEQSLEEFGTYPCTVENCPPYFQHQFTTLLLGETSRFMINLLRKSVNQAFHKMQTNLQVQTALKIIVLIIITIIYYFFDRQLRNRCRKAIQYFRVIPKKIMCSTKMTSFIRKNNILSKLQLL